MNTLCTYLPEDRCRALASGLPLPDRTRGAALFADISGFTHLTETLAQQFGARRGSEELTRQINAVYDALIAEVERYGGSVISFAGDAITCWFDGDAGASAAAAAQTMQTAMTAFPQLGLKVAVTAGPARRFAVGNPAIQRLDTLAGATIARLAAAEHLARQGDILADTQVAETLADGATLRAERVSEAGQRFVVLGTIEDLVRPVSPPAGDLAPEMLQPWVLPAVFERERCGLGNFLTELRPAVTLFVRFTGIDYDADEQAGAKLDQLICQVQAILARREGALLQLNIGDKGSYLYAVFGAPTAHEDDAYRAVEAAWAVSAALAKLAFLQPVQIGISQGIVRAGAYGGATRRTYGVLGDDVNLAARLMTTAAPGEILVSGGVESATAASFSFDPRPPLPIKGKAEPLPVFAFTGLRHQRAIRLEEPAYTLPMMGRQAELALIEAKLAAAKRGQGQVIGITAEAGVGKSRLVAEAVRLARKLGFTGYGGACQASGTTTPYLVWRPIWQAFFGLDVTAPLRRQIRILESEIEDRAPSRLPALPVLAPLLDLSIEETDFTRGLGARTRRQVLGAIVEECLRSAAQEGPVLLVLEDLHWLDGLSYELLEDLARVSANLAVCFVLAYRPADTAHAQEWVGRVEKLPHFTRVPLSALAAGEAEQLIRAKLAQFFPARSDALPAALARELMGRSEGNPFYLEELLNYLHDRGIDPYSPEAMRAVELPASLQALVLSRIDRLDELQKAALKTASVIGRVFSVTWLHGYYPALGAMERVQADLTELARLDLTPLDTPEPELRYLFKHIVTREVAYESLATATRVQLHEQLAQFIETLGPGRYLDLLAFHYSQTDNVAKQREYLQKAADAALKAYAKDAAIDYYTRLLPLMDTPQAQMGVYSQRAGVREHMGQLREAEADYHAALALNQTADTAAAAAQCLLGLASVCQLRGNHQAALACLSQARDVMTALNEQVGLAGVHLVFGSIFWRLRQHGEARREIASSLTIGRALGDKMLVAKALNNLGELASDEGKMSEAKACLDECLTLGRELNSRMVIGAALNNLAQVYLKQGDSAGARPLFEESLGLHRMRGDKRMMALTLGNLGVLAFTQHDLAEAQDIQNQCLALHHEMGNQSGIAMTLVNLAEIALAQGETAQARRASEEGLRLAQAIGEQEYVVLHLAGLAAVAGQQADLKRAARLAAAAEALRASVDLAWGAENRHAFDQALAAAHAGLDEGEFATAWSEGEQIPPDQTITYALSP